MITSTLNGITKWPGPGNSAYDAAAVLMGEEVRARAACATCACRDHVKRHQMVFLRHASYGYTCTDVSPMHMCIYHPPAFPPCRSSMATWQTQTFSFAAARPESAASGALRAVGRFFVARQRGRRTLSHTTGRRSPVPQPRAPPPTLVRLSAPPLKKRSRRELTPRSRTHRPPKCAKSLLRRPALTSPGIPSTRTCQLRCAAR